ncbi:Ropporin-1-like protein [Boothiomyces macroporosus]|uniref:Ropporin-1-like protein n=1 Tax=Boothiomyces macroporosus TaxID=261099 RepID=A0AAD5Y461_9FUNG|nr:Ropporin-1-like protein [Boothiomyces macroporosus]
MATGGIYSAEQIKIPPELPEILKNYAKFIIKSNPPNIIASSQEYFSRLSNQTRAMVGGKLSNEQLTTFYRKFTLQKTTVTRKDIEEACQWADVPASQIADTLALGDWTSDQVPWISFWAFLVASVAGNFESTLKLLIQLSSENGQSNLSLIRAAFEFLSSKDTSIDAYVLETIGVAVSSINGNVVPTEGLLTTIGGAFEAKPVVEQKDEPMEEQPVEESTIEETETPAEE